MNEQTLKLIEQLAQKLGTTSELLWDVLLRQAPVSATITLIQMVLVIIADIALYKAHVHFSNDANKINYDDYVGTQISMFFAVILMGIFTIGCWFSIEDVINGFFNREFWALDYILNKLKSK